MNSEIFTNLEDILNGLKSIQTELETDINDPDLHHQVIEDLENTVMEPLFTAIDSLSDILESVRKMDDADAFYDPYDEGLE
jgi:hypothetical protein